MIFTLSRQEFYGPGVRRNHLIQVVDPFGSAHAETVCELPTHGDVNDGIAGAGLEARFGPPDTPFANRLFSVTILNNTVYQTIPDGACSAFVTFDRQVWGIAFTADGSRMLATLKGGGPMMSGAGASAADENQGVIVSVGADGVVDPMPVLTTARRPTDVEVAPADFGAYAGQIFYTDWETDSSAPLDARLDGESTLYRISAEGESHPSRRGSCVRPVSCSLTVRSESRTSIVIATTFRKAASLDSTSTEARGAMYDTVARRTVVLAAAVASLGCGEVQPRSDGGPIVERLDPALDEILSVDATIDVIRQDYFGATEGPTWVPESGGGYLAFSDMASNRIYRWDPAARELSVLLDDAGFTSGDLSRVRALDNGRLMVALLGTNGLDVDQDGRLVFCAHGDRAIGRIEADGTRTILADRFEDKRFNGPNDLVVKSDGSVYFTDLGAPLLGGFADSPQRELDFRGVFRWSPDGRVQLISRELANGIAFSPDETTLYVTGGGVKRFDVMPDGSVANGRMFVDPGCGRSPGRRAGLPVWGRRTGWCLDCES